MSKSVVVVPHKVVIYTRSRSAAFQARIKLADGSWHRTSTKCYDEDEATERALELWYEVRAKDKNQIPQVSRRFSNVAKLAIKQMEDELKAKRGKSVYSHYIQAINNYLIPFFARMNMDSITPASLNEFEEWRRERMGKEPAASTITTHNSAFNRVFELAIQHGWAKRNAVPVLKNKGVKTNTRPTFSFAEYRRLTRRLREFCKHYRTERSRQMRELLRDYVLILANTGMRHGTEAQSLHWKNIEWYEGEDRKLYLQVTVSGKTGTRQLIARHNCVAYLTRLKNRFKDLKKLSLTEIFKLKLDKPVFCLADGTTTGNLHQTFEKFLEENELLYGSTSDKKRTLYSLRHFYATYRLYKGANIHQLAVQMGTSVGMLEKHYSKLTPMLMADEFAGRNYIEHTNKTED